MKLIILGAAAGGGFPQWNCNCHNCAGVRDGSVQAKPRTQSSICVAADDSADWALLNASPDILQQIKATRELQPNRALRDTGIGGILLVDGQIDHATGLFMLREQKSRMPLWCADPVYEDLTTGNPVLRVLEHYCGVDRQAVPLNGTSFAMPKVTGLEFSVLPLASKAAPYSPHREASVDGDNIGVTITDKQSGRKLFYAPGLGARTPEVFARMAEADCVMVDGTFWTDDEMIAAGLSTKTARDIGHLPQSGAGGMMDWLDELPKHVRKILIHINNTNPILDEASPQRAELTRRGIEVAEDGWRITI
ncbi:MAG: pyrroloquinoline quinone biosynthesis protein PqqB [Betaproteobacteria bacterium]|nr:pyrroloquinoline quinone biosynthesis protein PqqB [Betaproteobacteria bacterium]